MNMNIRDKVVIFEEDIIYFINDKSPTGKDEIMMRWETPIMYKHAEFVAGAGGDILELGFGMGISADFIQSFKPKSHTIIEIHPQIYQKAMEWAEGKENVKIILGDWYDVYESLGKFDGLFHDTYDDYNTMEIFKLYPTILNKGGRFTIWNKDIIDERTHGKLVGDISHELIKKEDLNIIQSSYFDYEDYNLVKIII